MDLPPPPPPGRRASPVVERKLDELCACLDDALSSRPRRPYAEARLAAEIKAKSDFLRSLLAAAEAECRGGGARPEPLAEAEARFAVLEATFEQWARRAAAPEPEEKDVVEEKAADSSGSTCSCTHSCQEAAAGDADAVVEARKEATADGVAGDGHDAEREAAAEPMGRTVQRSWWRRSSAAWCGAAGVLAVVAVGLAVEFAAVAHHNVNGYVVPT